jgi:hypothetical protein
VPICNEAVLHATVGLSAFVRGPVGLMDKASAPAAGESRFESWAGQVCGPVSDGTLPNCLGHGNAVVATTPTHGSAPAVAVACLHGLDSSVAGHRPCKLTFPLKT